MTSRRIVKPFATRVTAVVVFTLLATAGCNRLPSSSQAASSGSTLVTVSAQAEARQAPDIATLSTGVVSLAPDANSAIRRNAEQMARVVASIKAAGIAAKDVQTSGVSLNPDYAYVANRPPRIKGYYASNTVNATVRDIGRLGGILDALVATGANQINGPMFDIEDKDAVLDQAREKALAKARARADAYAKRLGLRVARIVSIDETGGRGTPQPVRGRGAIVEQASAADAGAPIAPGENVLGVTLDVVYELEK